MPALEQDERSRVVAPVTPSPQPQETQRPDARSILALQRSAGNAAVARALAGRSVGLDAFPHRAAIEARLARSLPGAAVVDPARSNAMGAEAFTEGTTTTFAQPDPPLEVAAHEAAHQLQHAGKTRDDGLGAEQHAQQIARAIADERTAAHLITQRGRTVTPAIRRYTPIDTAAQTPDEWSAGGLVRVSDDGSMAVKQDSQYGSHKLWASSGMLAAGNAALKANGSVVSLKSGSGTIKGTPPNGGAPVTLTAVEPENSATGTTGTTMEIWADCGKSARDVMGVGAGSGRNHDQITAKWKEGGTAKKTSASNPKDMADEILAKTLGWGFFWNDAQEGWDKYWAMSASDRDKFDKDHGLNRYAQPAVGGGFTMASGGAKYPGKSTWNFHWAGVIMSNGSDHVTLENYAVGDASVKNTDWDFQMYGPASKAGQTFHDQHKATQQLGQQPTTMAVGPR